MAKKKENADSAISIRFEPSLRRDLGKAAEEDGRTIGSLIRHIAKQWLARRKVKP